MGSVSIDIHKTEREYTHMTLSDENVIKLLLQHRSSLDPAYGASANANLNEAGDMYSFNVEIICMYSALDELISRCDFDKKEMCLLRFLFLGNKLSEIAASSEVYSYRTTYRKFNHLVKKIVKQNGEEWFYYINHFVSNSRGEVV